MARTKSEDQVLELVIGDDHTIVAYYFVRAVSWPEKQVGLWFLRDRLKRLGTLGILSEWWTDRCCDGAANVTRHPIVTIVDGSSITRAPRKDDFHAINGVNKTGNEGVPQEKSELGTDLFNALRHIPQGELEPVVDHMCRQNRQLDRLAALTKARSDYWYNGNRTHSQSDQLANLRRVRNKWEGKAQQAKVNHAR
jgi:hypothetical protein